MNQRILIIEDSRELQENTRELLELAGYDVVTAEDGVQGLEKARTTKPDLILCDIMMPKLDGYGVLRAISNIPELAETPFVYLTAKTEKNDFRLAMDLGADDYLTKPFSGDELLRVVSARLKKKHRAEETTSFNHDSDLLRIRSSNEVYNVLVERARKKINNKESIYAEGDTPTHLYHLRSGKIKLYRTNELGKEYISKIVSEGEYFGYEAILNDHPHRHGATAISPCEIGLIPRQEFLLILHADKDLAVKFICDLSEDLEDADQKALHLAYDSARKRVANALLFIYRQYMKNNNPDFEFEITRENLSSIAGISPESVSRNLSDFRDENLIVTDNGKIRISNFAKLAGIRG